MASERWRLDDWMRPARGEHYSTQPMQEGMLPGGYRPGTTGRRRRRSWDLADVTPKDRRSMVWTLVVFALAYAALGWQLGFARATSMAAGAFVVAPFYLWRLWQTRHVGWRTRTPEPRAHEHTPTAPTP